MASYNASTGLSPSGRILPNGLNVKGMMTVVVQTMFLYAICFYRLFENVFNSFEAVPSLEVPL